MLNNLRESKHIFFYSGLWAIVFFFALHGCVPQPGISPVGEKPRLSIQLSSQDIEPGHTLRVVVEAPAPGLRLELAGWGQNVRMLPLARDPRVAEHFLAVPLETAPGLASVTVTAVDAFEKHWSYSQCVLVIPRAPFRTVHLTIRGFGKYDFASESKLMAEARTRTTTALAGSPVQPFLMPVAGRLSETFGVKRIYNRGINSWYHGGWDIAAPKGTVIQAPADGQVILTRPFQAHGNTILIDHGFGVITTYLHQSRLLVDEGEWVRQGQPIGEVGSTGSSTGNHLHFQINVNGLIVDPADFIQGRLWPDSKISNLD